MEEFAQVLKMGRGRFAFEMIHELPGCAAHIGLKALGVGGAFGVRHHPMHPLRDFDQELQPAEVPNIAGQLGAIHPQPMGLHLEGGHLLVGDLGESLIE